MSSFLKSHGVSSSSSRRQQQLFDSLAFSSELTSNPDTFRLSTLNDGNAHVRAAAPAFGSSGLGTAPLVGYDGELSCVAFDPLQSLLAVGTRSGQVSVYGEPQRIPKCSWQLRPSQAVKHLVLKAGTSCVVVIDAKDTLHIFDLADLDEHGQPNRLIAHSLRSSVNCIEYVPQLSHVFLGCQDGTVETFDVDRVSTSPYRIRNLWLDQDELLRRSGVHNAPSKKRIPACTDLKTHPLDANQLLLAYEGGIVLYNLPEQVVLRVYEYLVLPGAPGGHNDQSEAAFLERRPGCTCLAWRPDGKMFAAGYDDGTVVSWSIDDGDRPVMARTLSMDDVNLATSSSLFGDNSALPAETQTDFREPIFKLAWSSFTEGGAGAKGGTVLTVLGGLLPDDPKGLHCLHLPPYVAPSLLSGSNPTQLREGLRASVKPNYRTIVPSETPSEDFTLLTANPHLGQSSDPFAVFMLLSADTDLPRIAPHTERGFAAFEFPPAPLSDPKELTLPMEMHLIGSQTVLVADAVTFPSSAYRRLRPDEDVNDGAAAAETRRSFLPLTGGDAPSTTLSKLGQPAPTKRRHTPPIHHGVLTAHLDMSVRLWDCSSSIPELLDSFSARDALSDDQLGAYLEGRILIDKVAAAWETTELAFGLSTGEVLVYKFGYAKPSAVLQQQEAEQAQAREEEQILLQAAARASEASPSGPHHAPYASNPLAKVDTSRLDVEMAAAASSMSVGSAQPAKSRFFGRKKAGSSAATSSSLSPGKGKGAAGGSTSRPFEVDLIDTAHYSDWTKDGYKPVFTLSLPGAGARGDRHVTALGLSDAGFLAVAWGDRLAIVDLRGPEVLFSEAETVDRDEQITSLTWAICAEGEDPERHPRLIVLYSSGLVRILTLSFTLDTWIVNSHAHTFQQSSLAKPVAVLLLDPFGNSLTLTGTALDDCLRRQESSSVADAPSDKSALNTLLIVVSEGGLTVKANLTGERLLRREFGSARAVSARVVKRYGLPVLVVIMHDGSCVVFSLPKCEEVKSMKLGYERSRASLSADGRILQSLSPTLFQYSTLFADQALPSLKFTYHNAERLLPAPPAASYMAAATSAAASYVSSWFSGGGSASAGKQQAGSELDDLLGGPKRPGPRLKPVAVAPVQEEAVRSTAPSGSYGDAAPGRPARVRSVQSGSADSQAQAQARMPEFEEVTYNKFGMPIKKPPRDPRPGRELVDALEQRGERLGFLNEHLDNASKASQDFVSQARRMAVTQGAKGAVTGVGKGISLGINKMLS